MELYPENQRWKYGLINTKKSLGWGHMLSLLEISEEGVSCKEKQLESPGDAFHQNFDCWCTYTYMKSQKFVKSKSEIIH